MNQDKIIEFRIATQPWEFEQIHQLNYRTFVNEIPQHEHNNEGRLVDKYHDKNTYVICARSQIVVGMLAISDQRPFSLESKIDDLFSHLPVHNALCEIRLLAIEKEYRNTLVFSGLLKRAITVCIKRNYDLAIISATTRQLKLYRHLGFTEFGECVGSENARYMPMYIDSRRAYALIEKSPVFRNYHPISFARQSNIKNYLPGPVDVKDAVISAFLKHPISHRTEEFIKDFNELRTLLCQQLNVKNVQLLTGSGTLANDIVSCYLRALGGKGLILVNGEFSQRLLLHATSMGLNFDILSADEGYVVPPTEVEAYLNINNDVTWIWTVICETSTGVVNEIEKLRALSCTHNIKLCLDGMSAVGSMLIDLSDVYMATAVSGKAIGSLPGIAMVFYQDGIKKPAASLPRYFDLSHYETSGGIPFTISSNAVYALKEAFTNRDLVRENEIWSGWRFELLSELKKLGLTTVAKANPANHVISIQIPENCESSRVGDSLKQHGYLLSYQSEYLRLSNIIQICFMGEAKKPDKQFYAALKTAVDSNTAHSAYHEKM